MGLEGPERILHGAKETKGRAEPRYGEAKKWDRSQPPPATWWPEEGGVGQDQLRDLQNGNARPLGGGWVFGSVSSGCSITLSQTRWLKTAAINSLTSTEAGNPEMPRDQGG